MLYHVFGIIIIN